MAVPVLKTATEVAIEIRRNADFKMAITVTKNGQPVDITNWRASMRLQEIGSTKHIVDLNKENKRVLNGGISGQFTFIVPGGVTQTIPWTSGEYNVIVRDPEGNNPEILFGAVTVKTAIAARPN